MMADELLETSPDELNGSAGSAGFDKSKLADSLEQWDSQFDRSFEEQPEPEETIGLSEHQDTVTEFEEKISALEGEKSEAIERADRHELLSGFVEETVARVDQHDFDKAVQRLTDEAGISPRVAQLELRNLILTDEDFREACDNRFDNPDYLDGLLSDLVEDCMERYPQSGDDHGLRAAVLAARSAPSGGGYDADSNLQLGRLSNEQFGEAKRKIFSDMKSGKLRPSGGRGGFFSTKP